MINATGTYTDGLTLPAAAAHHTTVTNPVGRASWSDIQP